MDPLAERYYHISPYAYCAGNPVRYIDPSGMTIEEGSIEEWKKLKQRVEKKRDRLQSQIDELNAKAAAKGWSSEKLKRKIGDTADRVASLNASIKTMGTLEGSSQVYGLSHTKYLENGGVTLNTSTNVIDISYLFGDTANFVHEMTHAGQFETGELAFSKSDGSALCMDLHDEVAAYQAQFAYDPDSVSGLRSTSIANSFDTITPNWVKGIVDAKGRYPYLKHGLDPVNINTTRYDLIDAYPWVNFRMFAPSFSLKTDKNTYYKR